MPDITGAKLARAMLKLRQDLPVILCTGYTAAIYPDEVYVLGIKKFIPKPLNLHEFARVVRGVLNDLKLQGRLQGRFVPYLKGLYNGSPMRTIFQEIKGEALK